MFTPTTQTMYAVARNGEVISDLYPSSAQAEQQLQFVTETMEGISLVPDVELVTVELKTTLGKIKPYSRPLPDQPVAELPEEPETPAPASTDPSTQPAE